jgi:GTPase SAR1 family protein
MEGEVEMRKEEVAKFLECVEKNKSSVNVVWNKTIERYARNIEKMKLLIQHEKLKEEFSEKLVSRLDNFINKCSNPEFHIAFVGAIKAGKSTLINALLGNNLASTSVTPETAALTKFRASRHANYIKLTFYNDVEWELLWKSVQESKSDIFQEEFHNLGAEQEKNNWINRETIIKEFDDVRELKHEIQKWTSSKYATHYFVKEVEVGLKDFPLPTGVVFVDTPGLDDPVKYRSDITRKYIDRANSVLVCIKSDALTGGELATIYSVFANSRYNPEKIYIIATQLDTLNKPEEDWKKQRDEWIKILKREDCYNSIQLAQKNIVAVAAHVNNLVREYASIEYESDDWWDLDSIARKFRIRDVENNLDKLMDFSNIELLKIKLRDEIIEKHKELLIEDLIQDYKNIKEDLMKKFNEIKERQINVLEASNKGIEEIQKKREESLKKLKAIKAEEEEMQRLLEQIQIATSKRAEELFRTINGLWRG